jgi:hypothetical protein
VRCCSGRQLDGEAFCPPFGVVYRCCELFVAELIPQRLDYDDACVGPAMLAQS